MDLAITGIVEAYALIDAIDDEGFERLSAHQRVRYAVLTAGGFAALAAISVETLTELRAVNDDLDAIARGEVTMLLSTAEPGSTETELPETCVDPVTARVDWACVMEKLENPVPPLPSHLVKPPHVAFALCVAVRGRSRDLGVALGGDPDDPTRLGRAPGPPGVRAWTPVQDTGAYLVELGAEDCTLLAESLAGLARNDAVARVRAATVVRAG
jgi:hypothetical protein